MRYKHDLHDLLHRIGNGDPLALEELDSAIRQPLMRYLVNQFSPKLSNDDIEDIIQFTLIQIWRYAPDYRGLHNDASARRLIFKIAKHRSWRILKFQRNGLVSLDDEGKSSGKSEHHSKTKRQYASSDNTENLALKNLVWREVGSLIETLSDQEKTVFRLRMEQGFTMDEIGMKVKRSKPRVKQILDSILLKIRTYYRS
jgi:RNA polymerase sigma factor (sigma-70 family)